MILRNKLPNGENVEFTLSEQPWRPGHLQLIIYYGPKDDRQKIGYTFTPEQAKKVEDELRYIREKQEKKA